MSNRNRSRDQGIAERHARACEGEPCTCTPTFKAQVYDARAGKRITKTFATITGARQWREDARSALRAGNLSADRGPTLREASDDWLAAARAGVVRTNSGRLYKPATIRGYEQNLRLRVLPEFGGDRLADLDLPTLQRYVDRLVADGLAPTTITLSVAPIRAIYRRAERLGTVKHNPTRGLGLPGERRTRPDIIPPATAVELLGKLERRDRALWATALYAGLRRGELYVLRPEDIDLAVGEIHVQRGWDVKEGEQTAKTEAADRRVPIPAPLRDYLDEQLLSVDCEYVFGGPNKARKTIERGTEAMRRAGLSTFHGCRHTYASYMIAAGVNAKALSEFMGHSSIAITFDKYGKLMPGAQQEAAGLLDAFLARAAEADTGVPGAPRTAPHPEQVRP